jgi:cytochrome c oxidase subunit 2
VTVILLLALRRKSNRPGNGSEDRMARTVRAAVISTAVIIIGLTAVSFYATRGLASGGANDLQLRVRGYQWWWEITYLNERPDQVFITANEIHVPVGRTINLQLVAADVIHSFWVPNLTGKQDLIPGRQNTLSFTPRELGVYRGQCAEFCGLQHAHMALWVVVDSPADFEHWRRGQLAPGATPREREQETGKSLFENKACASCHNIQGSTASGTIGPDLTHLASRRYIAAGLLPNSQGSIAAWLADPQTVKPGSNMPRVTLDADELNALSAYLASLK